MSLCTFCTLSLHLTLFSELKLQYLTKDVVSVVPKVIFHVCQGSTHSLHPISRIILYCYAQVVSLYSREQLI